MEAASEKKYHLAFLTSHLKHNNRYVKFSPTLTAKHFPIDHSYHNNTKVCNICTSITTQTRSHPSAHRYNTFNGNGRNLVS